MEPKLAVNGSYSDQIDSFGSNLFMNWISNIYVWLYVCKCRWWDVFSVYLAFDLLWNAL